MNSLPTPNDVPGRLDPRVLSPVPESYLPDVLDLFSQTWWTRARSAEGVAAILRSSQPTLGFLDTDGRLSGFVRVVTDFTFKAIIVDLIVDQPRRGAGIGRLLIDAVLHHPSLDRVEDFELYCEEKLVPYYESQGFVEPVPTRFMRLTRSNSAGDTMPLRNEQRRRDPNA